MKKLVGVLGVVLGVAACGPLQPFVPDKARLAPGMLNSGGDPDVGALNQATWAFADPGNTRGRPIEAARGAAGLEYVAGYFYTAPRWAFIDALTFQQLLQGRRQVRDVLGVVPGTPSQAVVNALAGAGNALEDGRTDVAVALLGAPVFRGTGAQTLSVLTNMPYVPEANIGTQRAQNELFGSGNNSRF